MQSSEQQAFDSAVRQQIYAHFVRTTRAPTITDTSRDLGASLESVAAAYGRLAAGRALALRPGSTEILMAHPFSSVETPFRVRAQGNTYWPNCAWDALGIAAVFGGDGCIEGPCADCQTPLELEVRAGVLRSGPFRIHFAVPPRAWWVDIEFT
jgi:DNA-binding transcriptional MocR family regulator